MKEGGVQVDQAVWGFIAGDGGVVYANALLVKQQCGEISAGMFAHDQDVALGRGMGHGGEGIIRRVDAGAKTLKDAINEAMRDWVANVSDSYYLLGSALGPHPYPLMVREFQSVIGQEARRQCLESIGRLPDTIVACVGGGSNAIGLFDAFIDDAEVKLIGVEAGGRGIRSGDHAARFAGGSAGVLQGTHTYVLQDSNWNIELTHSVSAGLDYAAVGPEHAWLHDTRRAEGIAITQ